jgi:hypothetical protein
MACIANATEDKHRECAENCEIEITVDMISAGVSACKEFSPELEEPEALVFAIIHRALEVARRNRETVRRASQVE